MTAAPRLVQNTVLCRIVKMMASLASRSNRGRRAYRLRLSCGSLPFNRLCYPSTLLFVLTLVRKAENEPFRNLLSIHCFLRYWRKQCRWSCWSLVSWSLLHRLTTASYPSLRWQMAVAGGHPIFERDAHFFYNRLVRHQAADPFFASTTSSILFNTSVEVSAPSQKHLVRSDMSLVIAHCRVVQACVCHDHTLTTNIQLFTTWLYSYDQFY